MIRSIAADGRPDLGGVFRPIERPRVLERLALAAQYRIATIVAPAGFGKSVAVRQFLATTHASVVYDVPGDATTLQPFVRGFAEALADAVPALHRSLASAFDGTRGSPAPGRDLGAWAATHLRGIEILVVLDDLHVGENDPQISQFVTTLIDRTKDGPRWLLSSRSPLQLPLASWLAYGESDLVVDTVDLRFTLDEAKRSARASRLTVRDDELESILELVDGWPAALTFALRTSTRANDLRAVSAGTREMVYRYLAEQLWNALDGRMRAFLRTAAFLPRLETRLAVAAGFDDAAQLIESLRERAAFISALDAGVYKLHNLFSDFIQHQIELEGEGALNAARIDAGKILETVGLPGNALERYIDARAVAEIDRLLTRHNFALLESGHYDVVERGLRALPSGPALNAPGVLAMRAAIEDAHGRIDQAEKWYAAVLAQPIDDLSFRVSVTWRYSLLLYQQGRLDAVPLLEALYADPVVGGDDRTQITGSLAMSKALAGATEVAQTIVQEALALAALAGDELRARTYGRAATVAFYAADEDAVERYAREATRLATECGAYSLAARSYATLSAQHSAAGRLAVGAWYAAQIATNAEKAGDPQLRARGLRELLLHEAERGNDQRVAEIEGELATLAYRGPMALIALVVGRGMTLIAQGEFAQAQMVLSAVTERDLTSYQHCYRLSILAVAAAAVGDRSAASQALAAYEAVLASDADTKTVFTRVLGYAERCVILGHLLLGRNAVAQRMLRAVRHRRDELVPFDAALNALVNRAPDVFDEALRALRLAGLGGWARLLEITARPLLSPSPIEIAEVLTTVERHVLRGIAQGLSNQAIADEQRRTVNTVRTHVSSILRKLGCESRGEAVAAARRRNLI